MKKYFAKIILLALPIILIILISQFYEKGRNQTIFNEMLKNKDVIFVGSSRIKNSINPNLFNNSEKVMNFGISGSTFFHNMIVTEYLITEYKPKFIYIELSPIHYTRHTMIQNLKIPISSFMKNKMKFGIQIKSLDNILFSKMNLKNLFKKIFNLKVPSLVGFQPTYESNYSKKDSFLEPEDFHKNYGIETKDHEELINYISKIAQQNNTTIKYILPITFFRDDELKIDMSVYNILPEKSKVIYSKCFIDKISNTNYLYDKNHLNIFGSKVMTNYINQNLTK